MRGMAPAGSSGRRALAYLARLLAGLSGAAAVSLLVLLLVATSQTLGNLLLESTQEQSSAPIEQRQTLLAHVVGYLSAPANALVVHAGLSYRERAHFREVKQLLDAASRTAVSAGLVALALTLVAQRLDSPGGGVFALGVTLRNAGFSLVLTAVLLATQLYRFDASLAALHWMLFDDSLWLLPADSLTARCFPASYFQTLAVWYGGCLSVVAVLLSSAGALLASGNDRNGQGHIR